MKPLRLLFLFLIYTTVCAHAQWEMQLDNQFFTHLDRIFFIDENYGWAIGGSTIGGEGPYYYTIDGGEHWYLDGNWWDIQGTDIVFVNHDTGFIAAQDGIILKTINGGQTWTEIQTPATQDVMRLFFVDENNGWASIFNLNDTAQISHTGNNGETWTNQHVFDVNTSSILPVYFLNDSIGFGGGGYYDIINNDSYSCIVKTRNKGEKWEIIYISQNTFYSIDDIYFKDTLKGWAVGQKGSINSYLILHTEDGGDTWEEQSIQGIDPPSVVNCVYFINDTTGWIGVGEAETLYPYGAIYFTNNGGEDWQLQQEFEKAVLDIQMLNRDTGWAVGADYIYHTTNGDTLINVGVQENHLEKNFIRINPNPFRNNIQLQIPNNYTITEIIITDYTGKICLRINENIRNDINLSILQSGIYLLQIQFDLADQAKILTTKIIKL